MRAVAVGLALLVAAPANAQRPGWDVRVPERVELTVGTPGTLSIAIAVDRGLVVSKDAPVIVELRAPAAIALKKRRLGRTDAVDPEADAPRFAVPAKSDVVGEHAVEIRLRFWLCGGRICRPVALSRKATLVVTAPAGHQPS